MGRVKVRERARTRVLSDEEIRDIFAALDSGAKDIPVCFGNLIRTKFLTAVRLAEAARLAWHEIEQVERDDFAGRVATIPASRMKAKLAHAVPLVPAVLAIIGERPADSKRRPFMFSITGGETPFSAFSARLCELHLRASQACSPCERSALLRYAHL
jgi:integrase